MHNVKVIDTGRRFTPQQALLDALDDVETLDRVVICGATKSGDVWISYSSNGTSMEAVGMLEFAKSKLVARLTRK